MAAPGAWVVGGLVLDAGAWLASLVALRALPVVVVQALLAGSVVVTAVLARLVLAARLRRTDVWAIGLAVAGLVVLTGAAGPEPPQAAPRAVVVGAYAWAAALVVATAALYRRGSVSGRSRCWVGSATRARRSPLAPRTA